MGPGRAFRLEPMPIGPGILTHSSRPSDAIYDALRPGRLDCWWNLAGELAVFLPGMAKVASEVLWAKIKDFEVPVDLDEFDGQLERVCAILCRGGHVHVSCFAGIGRTGMAIACVRVRQLGESADDAMAATFAACGGPITAGQKEFVRAYALDREHRAERVARDLT